MKEHAYNLITRWTGNRGSGTKAYHTYERSYFIKAENKMEIYASADPAFRGDSSKYNPEELLIASISSCHMLWYLHLCSDSGIIVVDYTDHVSGLMVIDKTGAGRFKKVTLHPMVTVEQRSMKAKAQELHIKAHNFCFIANSVNFEISIKPTCVIGLKDEIK